MIHVPWHGSHLSSCRKVNASTSNSLSSSHKIYSLFARKSSVKRIYRFFLFFHCYSTTNKKGISICIWRLSDIMKCRPKKASWVTPPRAANIVLQHHYTQIHYNSNWNKDFAKYASRIYLIGIVSSIENIQKESFYCIANLMITRIDLVWVSK